MKRITKQETLPALAVPEVLSVPELAYPARLGKRAVVQVLRKAALTAAAELSEEAETRAFLPTVTRTSEEPLKYTVVSAITCAISKQTSAR